MYQSDFFLPYNPKLVPRAKKMRKNMTASEMYFWENILKSDDFKEFKFLRQRPINNYIVDFYCSESRLVIEIDGAIHDEREEYDDLRTAVLEGYGLRVMRFTNEEVLEDIERVREVLLRELDPSALP